MIWVLIGVEICVWRISRTSLFVRRLELTEIAKTEQVVAGGHRRPISGRQVHLIAYNLFDRLVDVCRIVLLFVFFTIIVGQFRLFMLENELI